MGLRLFVALDLGDSIRRGMGKLIARLEDRAPKARWVNPHNVHLTLAFLGQTEEALVPKLESALAEVASRARPFELEVAGAGGFGTKAHPRVLWVGVEGELAALHELHQSVEKALAPFGYQPEHRAFRPHLTLARTKELRGDPALAKCVADAGEKPLGSTRVDRVILFRSQLGPGGA